MYPFCCCHYEFHLLSSSAKKTTLTLYAFSTVGDTVKWMQKKVTKISCKVIMDKSVVVYTVYLAYICIIVSSFFISIWSHSEVEIHLCFLNSKLTTVAGELTSNMLGSQGHATISQPQKFTLQASFFLHIIKR